MKRVILWTVTLLRVVLIPVFLWLGLRAQASAQSSPDLESLRLAALGTLTVMGISDIADGWIARRYELQTQIGAVVDAVADKLVQVVLVAFFTLSAGPAFTQLPLWFLLVIFGRDLVLLVGSLALRARYGPIEVVHKTHGRVTSVAVFAVLFWTAFRFPHGGLLVLMFVAAALAVVSGTIYALDGISQGRAKAAVTPG